jgi:hypothetical protein
MADPNLLMILTVMNPQEKSSQAVYPTFRLVLTSHNKSGLEKKTIPLARGSGHAIGGRTGLTGCGPPSIMRRDKD